MSTESKSLQVFLDTKAAIESGLAVVLQDNASTPSSCYYYLQIEGGCFCALVDTSPEEIANELEDFSNRTSLDEQEEEFLVTDVILRTFPKEEFFLEYLGQF